MNISSEVLPRMRPKKSVINKNGRGDGLGTPSEKPRSGKLGPPRGPPFCVFLLRERDSDVVGLKK